MAKTNSVLDVVGNTPLVPLSRISAGYEGEIYAKLEYLNPGGSHKMRVAKSMIEAAHRDEILKPDSGGTIIEATGGNTGLGLAMAGTLQGYKVILVVPSDYSGVKHRRLEAFGAQVDVASGDAASNGHGQRALELLKANPDWVLLNQAFNPANPATHRANTAKEIIRLLPPSRIRYLVAGIGTGGHITGVGEVLKEGNRCTEVIGVQPDGCDILHNVFVPHSIQGIAAGILPGVLNTMIIDDMQSITYEQALEGARALARVEAISAGLSSGANLAVAMRMLSRCRKDECVVTFVYDSAADYPAINETPIRSN